MIKGDFDESVLSQIPLKESNSDIIFNKESSEEEDELIISIKTEDARDVSALKLAIKIPDEYPNNELINDWVEGVSLNIIYKDYDDVEGIVHIGGIRNDSNSAATETLFRLNFPYKVTNKYPSIDTTYKNEIHVMGSGFNTSSKLSIKKAALEGEGVNGENQFIDIYPNPLKSNSFTAEVYLNEGVYYEFTISDENGSLIKKTPLERSEYSGNHKILIKNNPSTVDGLYIVNLRVNDIIVGGKKLLLKN